MRTFAILVLSLFALSAPAVPPDDASISGWIKDLGDDDGAKRDDAEKHLAENGGAAYGHMKAILTKGEASAEANARLKRLIAGVEHAVWWEKTWKENPIALANDYVKDERCGTCNQNKVPYEVAALEHPALAKRFPDIRFYALDWQCCEDKPRRTRILVVGSKVDVRFEIGNEDPAWAARLAPYIPAVTTAEDARETGSLLVSVTDEPEEFDLQIVVDANRGQAEETGDGFLVKVPFVRNESCWEELTFDKDGKLAGAGWKKR